MKPLVYILCWLADQLDRLSSWIDRLIDERIRPK